MMMTDREKLEQARYIFSVGKKIRHHVFTIFSRVERDCRCSSTDLTLAQMHLLMAVKGNKDITLTDLSGMLGVSPPSVSVMVERLVERGMLVRKRSTTDRRKIALCLTDEEAGHLQLVEEQVLASFIEIIEKVGPETARKWHEVLEQVEGALQELDEVATTGK